MLPEHPVDGNVSLLDAPADQNALAGRQSRRLDDHGSTEFSYRSLCGSGIGKALSPGRRDAVGEHQLLGKGLGGLDPRRGTRRPEDGLIVSLEQVHDAVGERRFRSHDGEVHLGLAGQPEQPLPIVGRDRNASAEPRDARVSGCRDQLGRGVVALQLPGEGVLAPTPADQQNPHFVVPRKAPVNASRAPRRISDTWSTAPRVCSP